MRREEGSCRFGVSDEYLFFFWCYVLVWNFNDLRILYLNLDYYVFIKVYLLREEDKIYFISLLD